MEENTRKEIEELLQEWREMVVKDQEYYREMVETYILYRNGEIIRKALLDLDDTQEC